MSDTAHIVKTLEDLKQQLSAKMTEASKLVATINLLEEMIGEPKTMMPFPMSIGTATGNASDATLQSPLSSSSQSMRPDQFLGEEPLEAAKKYLKSVGHALNVSEIADAIQRGGAAVKGSEWRDKLEMSLLRSVADVVKVREKTFGLKSFYTEEQIKRLRGTRAHALYGGVKKSRRGRPKKSATSPKALAPKPGITAVSKDGIKTEVADFKELTG